MIGKRLHVNIAEIKVIPSPHELVCLGLGSCVALILYDPSTQIGGLAHVMLPYRRKTNKSSLPGKFADTAVKALITKMEDLGAQINRLQAKMFGGAEMFSSIKYTNKISIGELICQAIIQELQAFRIPIIAKDIGGHEGRSIYFSTTDGMVKVKKIKHNKINNEVNF